MLELPQDPARRSRLGLLVDSFSWPLRTSHYLGLLDPLWSSHTPQGLVQALVDETRDARSLTLRPGRGWLRHRPGQYVRLGVSIAGRQHVRTYSLSSAPERLEEDGCITITVKAVTEGFISGHLVREIGRGEYLRLGQPQGDFVLPEAAPVRPLFITAGSGITPVMSMLRSFDARGELPDIVHLHYARRPDELIFGSELADLAKAHSRYRLQVVYTRAASEAGSSRRRFTSRQLDIGCPDWKERDVYACGPQPLLRAVESHWQQAGLASRLHVERFRAVLAEPPRQAGGGRVSFRRSGCATEADASSSLLRVAEAAGLCPPHGCRMGICHSCTTTLRAGCVRDLRNNRLIDEPGAKVQICVCAAAGNVELEL